MLIDYHDPGVARDIDTDVCVIGAGAAGITLARELRGAGLRIAVLESGGLEHDPGIQDLNTGTLTGLPYFPLAAARLRYFGGTTNHWNGWCAPLNAIDFQPRPWVRWSGWPIGLDALAPYYQRAQTLCELGPAEYSEAYWRGGYWAPPVLDSDKLVTRVWQISPPTRFGERYRDDLARADDVAVYLHANVESLVPDPDSGRIARARIRTLDGRGGEVRARRFVLACGGIENARVLLLAGARAPAPIGAGADWIGRCFMEHPHVPCGEVVTDQGRALAEAWYHRFRVGDGPSLRAGICLSEARQSREQLLNASVTLEFVPRVGGYERLSRLRNELLGERRWPDDFGERLWAAVRDFDDISTNLMRRLRGEPYRPALRMSPVTLLARSEQAPDRDSRIKLGRERDALGLERAELHWRLGEQDRRTLRRLVQLVGEEIGRLGLGRVQVAEWLRDEDGGWPPELQGGWHHMGTTRMSDSAATGVVDADCRVHGVDNLYVAGSSVFPTGGYANPTLTLVALAVRLADHLRATA